MEAENKHFADDSRRRSSKRSKSSGGKEKPLALDRISSLPNPLILHILSFLPTKLAAKTSVLSKNWQHLWTSVPILDFHDPSYTPYNMGLKRLNPFVSFVNHTLILHQSHKIDKFRVQMDYKKAFASDVHVWLRFATRKNVEELDLDFSKVYANSDSSSSTDDDDHDHDHDHDDDDDNEEEDDEEDDDDNEDEDEDDEDYYSRCFLPLNMFRNNHALVTLKLKNCEIDHYHMDQCGVNIYWKSLKVVSLCEMSVHNDFIKDMLAGCPSLEVLELLRCWNYDTLDIKNERLGKLVIIEGYLGVDDVSPMTILAPYVQSLEISGYLYDFSDINMKSLADAKLNFHIPSDSSDLGEIHVKYKKILVKLLKKLRHVKHLTVGRWCLQILSLSEEKVLPCSPSSLVCLSVDTSLSKSELPGITRLLALTPLLETWVINMTSDHVCLDCMHIETEFLNSYDLGGENYWSSQKSYVALALLNLKTVRIIGFEATKSEVELLFFLLKNASMLEKMVIHPQNTTKVSLKKSLEVAQSLLRFPRCSPDAVVLFS